VKKHEYETDPLKIAAYQEACRTGKPVYGARDEQGEYLIAPEDIVIDGVPIKAGEKIWLTRQPPPKRTSRAWILPAWFLLCAIAWGIWWVRQ
jgi:hypothetical protein